MRSLYGADVPTGQSFKNETKILKSFRDQWETTDNTLSQLFAALWYIFELDIDLK